jgi:hypothetical protein
VLQAPFRRKAGCRQADGQRGLAAILFRGTSGGKPMRNLLAFLAAGLLTFFALGWFLGWYQISSTSSAEGRRRVNIDLNTAKIGQDLQKGEQKIEQTLQKMSKKDKPTDSKDKPADTKEKPADKKDRSNASKTPERKNTGTDPNLKKLDTAAPMPLP